MGAKKISEEQRKKLSNLLKEQERKHKAMERHLPELYTPNELLIETDKREFRNLTKKIQERKSTYRENHSRILIALEESLIVLKRFPTTIELAEITGLSRQTISKHFQDIPSYYQSEEYRGKVEAMRETILVTLFNMGMDQMWTNDNARINAMGKFLKFAKQNL